MRHRHVTPAAVAAAVVAVASVAASAALIVPSPFTTPSTDRPTEVAASPRADSSPIADPPAADPGAHRDGPTDDDGEELTPPDGAPSDGGSSDASPSDGVLLDVEVDPKLLSAEAIIQRQLADHGWTVSVDGTIGPQTRRAIAEFQHANGLPPTGNVDTELSVRLASPDANGHQHYLADPLPAPEPPAAAAPRPAVDPMTRIEQIADSVGFDWRSRSVSFVIGCHPTHYRCSTGAYDPSTRQIFIVERILNDKELLRSIVLHEVAHAWQFTVRGWPGAADDMSAWGRAGIEGLEGAADCLASAWGASRTFYWTCPADAKAHMLALYQNS